MRLELEGVEVWADEWRERCSTTIQAAGAYVIVVETVVPSRTAGLSSCYLADLKGRTAVSHLRRAPGSPAVFSQRVLTAMAGATYARACLVDHAAELQAFLGYGPHKPKRCNRTAGRRYSSTRRRSRARVRSSALGRL